MFWFSTGIGPLLVYLERRLNGIPIMSLSVAEPPVEAAGARYLPPHEERYKIVKNANDVKPSIICMEEFLLVNRACSLLEKALGVKGEVSPAR